MYRQLYLAYKSDVLKVGPVKMYCQLCLEHMFDILSKLTAYLWCGDFSEDSQNAHDEHDVCLDWSFAVV
ncbi:hypothetical protein TNCT_450241 [Trichonephila clavata]|uniref:Uncharacterized protein n=1 Tax=Trichonephila clavata TaxID=2740835 RepID=A0A8X6F276_TRICU|nr:hypothetical protein TNCT_450241 [Trichonephila clavata]